MKREFPCNRCGYCCLVQLCPIIHSMIGGVKNRRCPAVSFDGDQAVCGVMELAPPEIAEEVRTIFGVGTGCDTLATAFIDGVPHRWDSLPEEKKIELTRRLRSGQIDLAYRRKE